MRIVPTSGSEWLAFLLLPFKVFVPAGYLMAANEREVLGYRMDTGAIIPVVVVGYEVSFAALVLGAMVQFHCGPHKAYLSTCGFIIALFVFVFLTLPYLAHT